jgi:hypothetical protein
MRLTDEQVTAMRYALTGDIDGYKRVIARLDRAAKESNGVLVVASFFKAAYRRFGENGAASDVVAFVSKLRTEYGLVEEINPRVAERLILATFTDEQIDDIDDEIKGSHYMLLLGALVKQAAFSDSELDEFLADARKLADEWLN